MKKLLPGIISALVSSAFPRTSGGIRMPWIALALLLWVLGCAGGQSAPSTISTPSSTSVAPAESGQSPSPAITSRATPAAASTLASTMAATPTVSPSSAATADPTSTVSSNVAPTPFGVPDFEIIPIVATGLLATVPSYAAIDAGDVADLVELVFPGRVPSSVQLLALLTEEDEAYVVIALDTEIDRFITAGTVIGQGVPGLEFMPPELDFIDRVIVSDSIALMDPIRVTPEQVNANPAQYAFQRIIMDTAYVFAGVRVKDAPPSLDHFGFGLASDNLGSQSSDDYLIVLDPYNTEAQLRVADLTGTVLFPTQGLRQLLGQLYQFVPADVEEALSKPSVFYESLDDDEAQLLNIRDLAPTFSDPSLKLQNYHAEMVSVQGIALGAMVRSEDIPVLRNIPVGLTAKVIGVVDLTGAMPLVGISSEDVSGEIFGFFRFDLSVYRFANDRTYAFLISKEAVPLDPITEVTRAEFGDRVRSSLSSYLVTQTERIQVAEDLTLEQVDLLLPGKAGDPIIMTRHPELRPGDFLDEVGFDGYLLDGSLLGMPEGLLSQYGSGVIVVDAGSLSFERGAGPVTPPGPTALPAPTPAPTYSLNTSVEPSGGGVVALLPPGGVYLKGAEVLLTATPGPGYSFDRWIDDVYFYQELRTQAQIQALPGGP